MKSAIFYIVEGSVLIPIGLFSILMGIIMNDFIPDAIGVISILIGVRLMYVGIKRYRYFKSLRRQREASGDRA